MLYDSRGKEIKPERDIQIDGMALPEHAIVDIDMAMQMHSDICNNALLRERLEAAERQTGRKLMHMDLLRNRNIDKDKQDALIKNQEFGSEVHHEKVVTA